MKRFLLLFASLLPLICVAQTSSTVTPYALPAITIDKISKKSSSPLPFDKSFDIQYQLDTGESLFNVWIYKVKVEKGERKVLDASGHPTKLPFNGIDTVKGMLTIHVPALPPNTFIDIAIERRLSSSEIDSLMIFNEDLYNYETSHFVNDYNTTRVKYLNFIKNNLTQKSYQTEPGFAKYSFDNYFAFFHTRLLPRVSQIRTFNFLTYNSGTPAIPAFVALPILNYDDLKTVDKKLLEKKMSDDDLIPLAIILGKGSVVNLMNGTADMTSKDPVAAFADDEDYETRIDNLTQAALYMQKFIALLERARMAFDLPAHLYDNARIYENALKDDKSLLVKNYNAMRTAMKSDPMLNANEWLLSQNQFNDLSLLSKNVLMPDAGLATMLFKGHQNYQAFPRPFIGLNIYFRPVDKTLSDNYFPKWDPWRNFSLQIGLTYGKLSGKEFSSLFNDFNLMVGPSYRFVRWFRLGLGTALAQETDANPLIAQTHTKFGYYVAFSFDLDILSNGTQSTARALK